VERYRALDTLRRLVAKGLVDARRELGGGPVGRWELYREGVCWGSGVRFRPLRLERRGDLGALAGLVHVWKWRWRYQPAPGALAGVDTVRWSRLKTWCGPATHLPFYLSGLAAPDEGTFALALEQLQAPILHERRISPAAGPAFRFMIALVPTLASDELRARLLGFLVEIATRGDGLAAGRALKRAVDQIPARLTQRGRARHLRRQGIEGATDEVFAQLGAARPLWTSLGASDHPKLRRWATLLLALCADEAADGAPSAELEH
jgi:hypothetical protein